MKKEYETPRIKGVHVLMKRPSLQDSSPEPTNPVEPGQPD